MYQFRLLAWIFAVVVAFGVGGVKVGIIAAIIAFMLSWNDRENVFGFAPFLVVIEFKAQFFAETGIASESQLSAPVAVRPPTSEYWPRRDGIRFTVLRLGLSGSDGSLIYWNNHHTFSTRLEHFVQFNEFEHDAPAHLAYVMAPSRPG